jgi:endonuclease YncB( thermonuclease family)
MYTPGWYQDPEGPSGQLRYWDGQRWTEQRYGELPPSADERNASSRRPSRWFARHKRLTALIAVVVVAWGVDLAERDSANVDEASGRGSSAVSTPADDESTAAGEAEQPSKEDGDKSAPATEPTKEPAGSGRRASQVAPPKPAKPKPAPKPQRTYLVTRVIDGDTIELGNGETVRLVGIDTPERGECGFDAATNKLASIVLDKRVRLTRSDEDRDRYDRLLRYVNVGDTDAGLRLIKTGLAIARYDSRDGYGFHPREPLYVSQDAKTPNIKCAPAPPQPRLLTGGGGGNCAPGYRPCIPPYPPDLNCADLNGPINVTGSDPHGLDADGDGIACES